MIVYLLIFTRFCHVFAPSVARHVVTCRGSDSRFPAVHSSDTRRAEDVPDHSVSLCFRLASSSMQESSHLCSKHPLSTSTMNSRSSSVIESGGGGGSTLFGPATP